MTTLHASSQEQLRTIIERLERIEDDRLAAVADAKEVLAEAKSEGFDPKIIKKVLVIRKKDRAEVDEEQALVDTYLEAIEAKRSGDDTPLGGRWAGDAEEARA